MVGIMPSMGICLRICAFGLSLFLFPVAFGCIDGKHFTSSSNLVCKPSLVKLPNLEGAQLNLTSKSGINNFQMYILNLLEVVEC